MATIEISNRWTDTVIYTHETTQERQDSILAMREAMEAAAAADANLANAYLAGAYLTGANLTGANLANANLANANLTGAYLTGANLTGANLTGANLAGAYLAGAYLAGAKWRGITIQRAPMQLHGLRWPVTILDSHMQIGCELHSLHEWAEFNDSEIVGMDGRDALRFWRAHKSALLALAASDGRV
jgi:hypothetical protein